MTRLRSSLASCSLLVLSACAGLTDRQDAPSIKTTGQPRGTTASNEAQLYLSIVDGLENESRYGAALSFLESYAQCREPATPRYWFLRASAELGLGRNQDALASFARLDNTPLAGQGWNGRGRLAAARQDWQTAAENFQHAIESDPTNANFLNNLAFADMHLGKADNSAMWLRQAHELNPGSELIRNNLIMALTLTGDQQGADGLIAAISDPAHRDAVRTSVQSTIASTRESSIT